MNEFGQSGNDRPTSRRTRRYARGTRRRSSREVGPWKHGPIPVIGLVGGIGAGKSTVAAALERRGAFVIDADRVGHALLDQPPSRDRIVRRFGPEILRPQAGDEAAEEAGSDEGPTVDRRALGAIVFADPTARRDLEAILHPRMRDTFEKAIGRTIRRAQHSAVVLDAAVLYEAGWDDLCDLVAFVDADRPTRLARTVEGRGWSDSDLDAREAAQLPLSEKAARADVRLSNSGEPEQLDAHVARFWDRAVQSRRGPHR